MTGSIEIRSPGIWSNADRTAPAQVGGAGLVLRQSGLPCIADLLLRCRQPPVGAISEHIQLDCGPDPTSPALRASSASFVKIFFPAMRPDSQAPVI